MNRKPVPEPLYDIDLAYQLAVAGQFALVTDKAKRDYRELEFNQKKFAALVDAIRVGGNYRGRLLKMKSDVGPVDCDHYAVCFDEENLRFSRDTSKHCTFYLKFALTPDTKMLVVSVHLSS